MHAHGSHSTGWFSRAALLWFTVLPAALAAGGDWPPAPRAPLEQDDQVGLLPPSVTAERSADGLWSVTFTYQSDPPAGGVTLAGTFNSWNPSSLPMEGPDGEGVFRRSVTLGAGEYRYKFVVGGEWTADPRNPDVANDGFGNSLLHLGRVASLAVSNAVIGDDKVETIGLLHTPTLPKFFQPVAPDELLVRYRTLSHDVDRVWCVLRDGPWTEMHAVLADPLFTIWEAAVKLPDSTKVAREPGLRQVEYAFVLADRTHRVSHPHEFSRTFSESAVFETPEWARNAIWYQIMLDRFRNGNPGNDPDPVHPWTSDWFAPAEWEGKDGQTFYKFFVFDRLYGGDLAGLEQKLDYLKDLGVNAIYLNPIFQAPSHHKYNAVSFVHIDEHFGTKGDYTRAVQREKVHDTSTWIWTDTDKRFLALLKKAKSMGFRVILDGVFNHVGDLHPAFQDVKSRGKESPYADWFEVTSWEPFEYNGWAGHGALPVFRKDDTHGLASEGVRAYIYAITRRWMDPDGDGDPSDGIDGWRLDVPNEIPAVFWERWRELVKSINPEAYITGEIWERAEQWLDGRHFDAVMNYPFAHAAVQWIVERRERKISASQLDRRLAELRLTYPATATYCLQNLIDSHDTDRVASMAINPDRVYDAENRVQDSNPDYNNDKPTPEAYARARLVALLQMTYIGAPMIYYGDEVGMWGADDPTCRKPMLWKDLEPYERPEDNFVMTEHLRWYRAVIRLRNEHPTLRSGQFMTLLTDNVNDSWVFGRYDEREKLIVALNASGHAHELNIPLPAGAPARWRVLFRGGGPEAKIESETDSEAVTVSSRDNRLMLNVPAIGGAVLIAVN